MCLFVTSVCVRRLQGAKKGDVNALDASALSDAVVNLTAACDVMTPDERAIVDALAAYDAAARRVGQPSRAGGVTYSAATTALSNSTKALLTSMSKLQAASKANAKDMPAAFGAVADAMPKVRLRSSRRCCWHS